MPFSRLKAASPLWREGVHSFRHGVRTWHFRLMIWNTGVVLLTVFVTLAAVREGLRWMLLYETEGLLDEDAEELVLAFQQFYPNMSSIEAEMERKATGHVHRDLFVQLLDAQGEIRWSSVHTPSTENLLPDIRGRLRPIPSGGYLWSTRDVEGLGNSLYAIRVGCSLAHIREDVTRLSQLMLAVGAVLTLVSPLGGYWLANRAAEPLKGIIRSAEQMRPTEMHERLPNRGTGDELDRLSATINALLDRIADYLGRHREFVANAAHELRSPLAAIQSSVDVALNSQRTVAEYQELLYNVVEECAALSKLVNDLLLLAETDAGPTTVVHQVVDVDQLVQKAVEMFRGIAEDRGIALTISPPQTAEVLGDAPRLRQVVNNLVDNALKFTPAEGHVTVSVRRDVAAKKLQLVVADDGPGIAAADLPHVFERFYQGNKSRPRETHQRGNGLGLSICQSIVEAHGGEIEATSKPGAGARFCVTLPLHLETEGAAIAAPVGGHEAVTTAGGVLSPILRAAGRAQ